MHQALLAHATDLTLIGTALRPFDGISQADSTVTLHTAVTSHTLWFHRPFRVDGWLPVVQEAPVVAHGRRPGRGDGFAGDQRGAGGLVADGPDKPFLDGLIWDAQRWLVVGAYGLAFRTDDAGATWTPWMARLPNPKALHWYVARRAGETLLLAGEPGLLAWSDDSGTSFRPLASPYKGSWFAGELLADGAMLLAGLRGTVWRSAAGGTKWAQITSPVQALYLIHISHPTTPH